MNETPPDPKPSIEDKVDRSHPDAASLTVTHENPKPKDDDSK